MEETTDAIVLFGSFLLSSFFFFFFLFRLLQRVISSIGLSASFSVLLSLSFLLWWGRVYFTSPNNYTWSAKSWTQNGSSRICWFEDERDGACSSMIQVVKVDVLNCRAIQSVPLWMYLAGQNVVFTWCCFFVYFRVHWHSWCSEECMNDKWSTYVFANQTVAHVYYR